MAFLENKTFWTKFMENPNSIDLNISKNITDFIVQSRIEGQFLKINRVILKK